MASLAENFFMVAVPMIGLLIVAIVVSEVYRRWGGPRG